jgi:muramoyltetrapeptide carboxypeptidase
LTRDSAADIAGAKVTLSPIRKPPRIRAGDVIGVVAPSGALDPERLEHGVRLLEGWGWQVRLGDSVRERHMYLAGHDEVRRADLQRMIDAPEVRAVFCARGGYGSQRLVPALDLAGLRERPKPLIGYSDATALLAAALSAGVLAVHGPMVADDMALGLSIRSQMHLRTLLEDPTYVWEAEVPETVCPGRATGRLMGGCLSVLATTLGTPWAPDTDGAILFLEDVRESPYRLDRLLTHLGQSGKLDRVAGLVFGTMAACPPVDGVDPLEVVRACCGAARCPVGFGVPSGHAAPSGARENLALPFGVSVVLDTERGRLAALEPAVV